MLTDELLSFEKADLHVHLEGTVDSECLQMLAHQNKVSLDSPTMLSGCRPFPAPPASALDGPFNGSFQEFISLYLKITSAICRAEDLVFVAERYARSARSENIIASEIYVTPTTFQSLGFPMEEFAPGLKEAERVCREKHQLQISWIFDIVRNNPSSSEVTLQLAEKCRRLGVNINAIGVAGLERGYPAMPFRSVLEAARSLGYQILVHAGETAGADSVAEAFRELGADRIGHGISAMDDPQLQEELAEKGTIIEVSPWSNICLGNTTTETHPIREMVESGLQVVLVADDPGIFEKNLTDNYRFAADRGVSILELQRIAERSKGAAMRNILSPL